MHPSLKYFIIHGVCTLLLAALALVWKIPKRWAGLFTLLFFFSPPAVFLQWGPFRYYGIYAGAFFFFLFLAKACHRFYVFLQSQEVLIKYLFWAAVAVFCAAVFSTSMAEINLRRDTKVFWQHESKRHPTAEALDNLADAYWNVRNFTDALESYRNAAKLAPKSIRAYEGMVRVLKRQQQWDDVLEVTKKILSIDARASQAYLDMGQAYRILGNSRQAVETYSRLLDLFPDDENIDVKVIEAYGQAIAEDPKDSLYKEKREEVLADFEQLSKRKNYSAADYYNLAFLYEQVGGKEEAMRFYAKAVEMKPNYKQALYNLANLYRDAGNYKVAMALYERLAHFHPQFAPAYLNMGTIINALGDQQKARQLYLKVISLDPANSDAYYFLGYLSESQGELNDAVNYYEKTVELAPKNAEAYYNLGNVYASLGQNGEAIASYLKSVAINPKHQDAFVNLSILSFKSRDFQGAIHYLADAQALGYNPPVEYLKTLEPYRK